MYSLQLQPKQVSTDRDPPVSGTPCLGADKHLREGQVSVKCPPPKRVIFGNNGEFGPTWLKFICSLSHLEQIPGSSPQKKILVADLVILWAQMHSLTNATNHACRVLVGI